MGKGPVSEQETGLRPARVFRIAAIASVLGVFLGSAVPALGTAIAFLSVSVGIAVSGIFQDRRAFFLSGIMFALASGTVLSSDAERFWDRDRVPVTTEGTADIVGRPEDREYGVSAVIRFSSCGPAGCPKERIEAVFSPLEEPSYGDRGTFSCLLDPIDPEWRMWYATRGIAYRCRDPQWRKTGESRPVRTTLMRSSSRFEESLARYLPEPEAGLAAGLLLGGDKRLPEEVREAFRDAGLTHIVAVSGYNISVIAEYFLFLGILLTLPRRRAAPFALLATTGFVFVAGAPSSAVRALFMAGTLMLAQWLGRRYESLFALVFVAAVMLLFDPLLLVHDIGFQLSFLATAGIVLAGPRVGRVVRHVPKPVSPFFEAFLVTVAANLLLIPILLSNFGRFVPAAILTNTVLLPVVPVSMSLAFLTGLLGMFSSALGTIFSFPTYAALHLIVEGARFGAGFGDTAIETESFGWGAGLLWYGALAWIFFRIRRKRLSEPAGDGGSVSSPDMGE